MSPEARHVIVHDLHLLPLKACRLEQLQLVLRAILRGATNSHVIPLPVERRAIQHYEIHQRVNE